MRLKSYSKLNLSLRVLKKLKNRMHDIETNSVLINLYDEINIKRSKKNIIIFKGKFKKKVNKNKNTVLNTIKLLKKLKIIKDPFKIIIKKNIPVFAGLGGGTSNSFSIARYFIGKKINEKLINLFAKNIGTDFRLFLYRSSFQKNLKKVVKKNDIPLTFIIMFPNVNCRTKNIYKKVKNYSKSTGNAYLKNISKRKTIKMLIEDRNDLQKIVEKKYSKIQQLIQSISNQNGCIISRMTASGSACFGAFNSTKAAKLAMVKLKRKYPKYWCAITKTI